MWTLIDGFDKTNSVRSLEGGGPFPITFTQAIGDAISSLDLTVVDKNSQLALDTGMEVIVWDENAPPTLTPNGITIPTIPAHNFILNSAMQNNGTTSGLLNFVLTGPLFNIFTFPTNTFTAQLPFVNYALGSAFAQQVSLHGYVKPGQKYLWSVYVQGTGTISNIQSIVKIQFMDVNQNLIGGITSDVSTPPSTQTRISVSATAPSNAYFVLASFGGQSTVAGSNSGTIVFSSPQLEPMWFAGRGVSYPTPDLNRAQVAAALMPDGTYSRMCRLYSGYIDTLAASYEGLTRLWTLTVAPPSVALENNALIDINFSSTYDDTIISTVVGTYFVGMLSIAAPNTTGAVPIVRGVNIGNASYADVSFKDILNSLADQSGYTYYVDPYYRLHYNPSFYGAAAFGLSDQYDNVTTFNYIDYSYLKDATQRRRQIRVIGGKFFAPFTDLISGNGSTVTFTFTYQPYSITSLVSAGVKQRVGVSGVDSFLTGTFDVLVDKPNKLLTFNAAPPSGVGNIVCDYSYERPISAEVIDQDTTNVPNAPAYAIPNYVSKVHNTAIGDTATAVTRGLAELSKLSKTLPVLSLKTNVFIQPGLTVYFTSHQDGIINQPYILQTLTASYLGNGVNEYACTLGAYLPTMSDHLRHAYQTHTRSISNANVTDPQQTDIVFSEYVAYSEQPVIWTNQTAFVAKYGGPGTYGFCSYS